MKSTTRTAAGVLAVALAFGAGSPVAAAAADHAKPGHVKVAKGDKSSKGNKGDKGDKALRQVLRDIEKADERLAKVARESRTAAIGDHAAAVLANVAADRAALAALALAVQSPESGLDLRATRKAVKDVEVQNYSRVINDLRHALELAAEIAAARTATEGDASAPVAELDAAQASVDAAVAKALLVTAASDRDELRAVKADLEAAHAALDVVLDYLESLSSEEEPVVEEPVQEEPVQEEPPVVEEPATA